MQELERSYELEKLKFGSENLKIKMHLEDAN